MKRTAQIKSHRDKIINLAAQNEIFRMAVKNAFNHIVITDINGKVIYANNAVERITGYPVREVIGKTPRLWGGLMSEDFYRKMWHTIKDLKKPFAGEIKNRRKNGVIYIAKAVISPILDNKKNLIGYIGTEEDITQVKEVDRMKTEFISIAAHQLRTPLTSISWNLDILATETGRITKEQSGIIMNIKEATEALNGLVNSLLNISRIEMGRLAIEPEPTDINKLAGTVIREFEVLFKQKKQTVEYKQARGLKKISIDPKLVGEVYRNLLSNAIKYTPDKGRIKVELLIKGNDLVSSVADTGFGIPKDEEEMIFSKFYRATNAKVKVAEGNGLGLYFIKQVVEASGGKIWVESPPSGGTTFYFSVPLAGSKKKKGEVSITSSQIKKL